jgi:hypothetical protein
LIRLRKKGAGGEKNKNTFFTDTDIFENDDCDPGMEPCD